MYRAFEWLQTGRQPHTAPVAIGPAATLLSLPQFADRVPIIYVERDNPALLEMARRLAHAGVLGQADRRIDRTLHETLINVLSREINEVTGNMQTFDVHCHYSFGNELGDSEIEGACMTFYIYHRGYVPEIHVESALAFLNTIHADLGQTLYAVMEKAASASLQIHTFHSVMERFEYELQLDPELREEFAVEEGYEFHDIDAMTLQFPFPWVCDAQTVLSPKEIAAIATQEGIPAEVFNAIAAAIDIGNCFKEGAWQLGQYTDCVPVHAVAQINFAEHDPTAELVDNVINHADQCSDSYTGSLHEQVIDVNPDGDFAATWSKTIAGFRLLGALDRLVTSLDKINKGIKP